MPFIGRDWRSPGEVWVKTDSLGWQRMKIIESQLSPSCLQNPACSWPPQSEFGQHMATNCKKSEPKHGLSSSSDSGSSSSASSRASSMSPSPTGSPEKSAQHLTRPITISSPYGKYSCCSHHFEVGSPRSTNQVNLNCFDHQLVGLNNAHLTAQACLPRSLSRESVRIENGSKGSGAQMRYNKSVSDFRNADAPLQTNHDNDYVDPSLANERTTYKPEHESTGGENVCSTPILLKNGCEIDDAGVPRDCDADIRASSTCCCTTNQCHQALQNLKEPYQRTAPFCQISVRTREVAMYNTISEAFYRLDFCNAIHDIRRFNYICKLLHLMITQNLTSLSGCATKVLFTLLEQVAWEVSSNKRNIHVLKDLLNELRLTIQKYYCWGRPIGSSLLWQQHFDTIERISQIVDGIELSPPRNENTQITFNDLPIEMIREIMLRLNDYRDLVSSAQASPVMRTMIDSQYIWHQLCRYHFTKQQLKMAVDDRLGSPPSRLGARGVKYARTTSADGRTSFRNPVAHKSKIGSTTRQQLENTSGRRGNTSRQYDVTGIESSSQVTRAIKIFDRNGNSSVTSGSTRSNRIEVPTHVRQTHTKDNQTAQKGRSSLAEDDSLSQSCPTKSELSPSSHEIDWERVFHQLRKKFDLKEEYADCLLLCRHCRCLFWKSFGHPCIKNDNYQADRRCPNENFDRNRSCLDMNQKGGSSSAEIGGQNMMQASQEQSTLSQDWVHPGQHSRRLSVAALSRNFDSRAQGMNPNFQGVNNENIAPASSAAANRQPLPHQRQPNDNFAARIREQGIRLANRRLNEVNGNNNNNDVPPVAGLASKRHELVPKHVAISPQAFLKFFSL